MYDCFWIKIKKKVNMKTKIVLTTCFILTIFFLSSASNCRSQSSPQHNFDDVRELIKTLMKTSKTPSISVAVAKDGKIIWEESFGWANREKQIKATPQTMYSLASISKPFTATGLMILAKKGLIDIHQPANIYLGEARLGAFEGDVQEATVQRILHHTAGLPMHWNFFFDGETFPRPTMDETIKRFGILIAPPGDRFEYSNLGYGILEYIIERISNKSYPDFMEKEVFEPLGLHRTTVFTKAPDADFVAERYIESKDSSPFYDFDHRGASAIYSSAHDLVRFGMFHLKNKLADQQQILSEQTIEKMQKVVDPKLPDCHYKLGWDVGDRYGYKVVSHGGGMPGVRTILLLLPTENIALSVLSNGVYINLSKIYDPILATIIPGYKKKRRETPSTKSLPFSELTGEWIGEITTYNATIPVKMIIENKRSVRLIVNKTNEEQVCEPINSINFNSGFFTGKFNLELPFEDASRARHSVFLKMKYQKNRLSGFAAAMSFREFFCLPSYIELRKK